jgi:dolichol-phosphate mannosyltransferase
MPSRAATSYLRPRCSPVPQPAAVKADPGARDVRGVPGVPDHTVLTFADRKSRWCLCVFVLNEADRIRRQVAQLADWSHLVDVVIADGGSTDGSLVPEELARKRVRALLTKVGPGRLSAQMRMAFHWAIAQQYDGVIVMDGNSKDDPAALPSFVAALESGYDHVQGSRYIEGGRGVNTPIARHIGVTLLHAPVVSIAAGTRHTDTTNGFRAYSRRLLLDPRVSPLRDVFVGYELHYYLAIRASRLGFRVTEVPVTRSYPSAGPTPSKIRGLRGNLQILRTLFAAALHRYDP